MNLASFLWDCVGGEVNPETGFDAATCWQRAANVDGWFPRRECAEGMGSGHSDTKINYIFLRNGVGTSTKPRPYAIAASITTDLKQLLLAFPLCFHKGAVCLLARSWWTRRWGREKGDVWGWHGDGWVRGLCPNLPSLAKNFWTA